MICSGDRAKLLVVKVKVGENEVEETKDEKLLCVLMSNNYSWNSHLYGNGKKGKDKVMGLVPKLSQRVGRACWASSTSTCPESSSELLVMELLLPVCCTAPTLL